MFCLLFMFKVTPSCTAVYVDGSETKGSVNATVLINFGNEDSPLGIAQFTVWYPEFPVEVWLSDRVLNAIKSWRVPIVRRKR